MGLRPSELARSSGFISLAQNLEEKASRFYSTNIAIYWKRLIPMRIMAMNTPSFAPITPYRPCPSQSSFAPRKIQYSDSPQACICPRRRI
ncbi:Hypothetical protein FKW44_014173 [Caligus rogercresseyi]|uniref:Uncharacterized protein n=1 Tax=Caligus rogercresseyi TaxID=217165 RepID=A0A7T8GYH7_CALRO|nr:Hypothetical protein FKW44_014173 [Caligus rogercresseyi]